MNLQKLEIQISFISDSFNSDELKIFETSLSQRRSRK